MKKRCCKCKILKDTSLFSFSSKAKGTLVSFCKECKRDYNILHYKANKDEYVDRNKKRRDEKRAYIEEVKKKSSCVSCGIKDYRVLDFHHISPTEKKWNVSAISKIPSMTRLKQEIDKCDILCANCHRIYHHTHIV